MSTITNCNNTADMNTQTIQIPEHITTMLNNSIKLPMFQDFVKDSLSEDNADMFNLFMQLRLTQTDKFCVDFDLLWKSLEFTRKDNAKALLIKILNQDSDYLLLRKKEQHLSLGIRGGSNKETIMLTIEAAQKFALQSQTAKSKEIVDFFVDILKLVQDYYLLSALFDQNN